MRKSIYCVFADWILWKSSYGVFLPNWTFWDSRICLDTGEYDYVDVIEEGDRLIVDIDFKSEFEIARSTKKYKAILQTLRHICSETESEEERNDFPTVVKSRVRQGQMDLS